MLKLPPLDKTVCDEPSAFMSQSSLFFLNAILVPSGETVGSLLNEPSQPVRDTGFDPSAFMTKISRLQLRDESNAILPSGNQPGSASVTALKVSWVTAEPSAFIVKTSKPCSTPSRQPSSGLDTKT